jgi:hypothetical protein
LPDGFRTVFDLKRWHHWQRLIRQFAESIVLPGGTARALHQAVAHLEKPIPKSEHMLLMLNAHIIARAGKHDGFPIEFLRIATQWVIHRRAERNFYPVRKDPGWGKPKLNRKE